MAEARGFLAQNEADRFRRRIAASLADQPLTLEPEEHRRQVAALLARLGEIDFYELLQLPPHPREEELHRAYVATARLVHPQNAPRLALPAAEAALELLFERATEAYLTLADPDRAAPYAAQVKLRSSSGAAEARGRDDERRREATRQFRIAESLALDGRYHDAVQLLQQVVRLDRKSEHFALLSECLARNPRWLPRAIDAARTAVELAPQDAALRASLGRLHDQRGERRRALARYREALDLDPNRADVRAAVERLEALPEGERHSRLLRRLLGRLGRSAGS